MRWPGRRRLLAGLGAAMFVGLLPAMGARADGSPSTSQLGGYSVGADANSVDIVVDSPAGLAGQHPISEADLPEASSDLETGPYGTGKATLLYPGAVIANFGSASQQLNFGLPSQVKPILADLNDPVLAVASYPGGPPTATYPSPSPAQGQAAEMTSSASATEVDATGALSDVDVEGILSFGGIKSTSSSNVTSSAFAAGTTSVQSISLLNGLIEVDGVTSTSDATSDGSTATVSASTTPGAVTIAGYKVGIDSNGIDLGPVGGIPLVGGLITNELAQLISVFGLKIVELPETKNVDGGNATVESGALQISITLPAQATVPNQIEEILAQLPSQLQTLPTIPQLLHSATVTITVGRSTSTADASPAFDVSTPVNISPETGTSPAVASLPNTVETGPIGGSDPVPVETLGPGASLATTPSVSPTEGPSGSTSSGKDRPVAQIANAISLSTPIRDGSVALAVVLVAASALLMRRFALRSPSVMAGRPCPLEAQDSERDPV